MSDEPSGRITKINPDGSFEATFDASKWKGVYGTVGLPPLEDRMAAMLRRLEWWGGTCPMCCVERYTGHAGEGMDEHLVPVEPPPHSPDCDLAALIRELP